MTLLDSCNAAGLLCEAATRHPDRAALLGAESVSFGDLWDRVDRCSAGLLRDGLKPGDRAICMIPMSVDLYVVLLGLMKAGAVAVFVDPWIGMAQIAAFSAFAEPRAWVGVPRSHALRTFQKSLRRLPVTITTGSRLGPLPARRTLRELLAAAGNGTLHPAGRDDPALVTFTSGSSGTPKGANRTHGFLRAQHAALRVEFPAAPGDVDMTMFPVFALNNIALGVPTVIPDMDFRRVAAADASRLFVQMERHAVTTCTASPPFFDRLAALTHRHPLRRILTGGAPVSDRQLDTWRAAWPEAEIIVAYGSTEAEPVAHISAPERREVLRRSPRPAPGYCAGRPTSQVRTRVIRIRPGPVTLGSEGWSACEVEPGCIGELVVTGEHVGRDYFRNPQAVAENKIHEADGTVWHRMGDTGYFDDEGRFWLVGRVHSTILRGGTPVHPQLLEQAAAGPGIRQVAAIGVGDPVLGERAVVVVHGEAVDIAGVRARIASGGLVVDEVVLSNDVLPVDPRHNAKIDYAALRRRWEKPA